MSCDVMFLCTPQYEVSVRQRLLYCTYSSAGSHYLAVIPKTGRLAVIIRYTVTEAVIFQTRSADYFGLFVMRQLIAEGCSTWQSLI